MLDIKFIRQNQEIVRRAIKNKKINFDLDKLLALDERRRHILQEFEQLKSEQNKKSKSGSAANNIEELRSLKEKIKILTGGTGNKLTNLPHSDQEMLVINITGMRKTLI